MTLLIDPPNAPGHGRLWSHLASDTSYDELHAFARTLGVPDRGFDGDHYDVPAEWYDRIVAAGVVPVSSRELIERLTTAGLRVRKSTRMRPRRPGRRLLLPPALSAGDTVAIVSVAGVPDEERLARGRERLERWGLRVVGPATGAGDFGWLAGPDRTRAAAFEAAWHDPGVRAIWCARGGFGTQRILDLLDWRSLAQGQPKWLVGFSDITALHQAIAARLGVVTAHAAGVTGLDEEVAAESVRALLFGDREQTTSLEGIVAAPGTAEGVLVGGNLTLLASSAGLELTHPAVDSIAVLEDVGEQPYRLDRAVTQLARSGWFHGVRGIVCGAFTDCGDPGVVQKLLAARLGEFGVPMLTAASFGHEPPNRALPLGWPATLEAPERGSAGRLSWATPYPMSDGFSATSSPPTP